jgi:hypothetical protein
MSMFRVGCFNAVADFAGKPRDHRPIAGASAKIRFNLRSID